MATSTKATQTKTASKSKKEETKTAFDILLETQSKFVDSFVENSKKFTETLKLPESLNANEQVEKSRTFVNEWLEKQEGNLESSVESIKKQVKFEEAPVLVKEAVEAQQDLGKEWFIALRKTLKANDLKELNEILTANAKKMQSNVKEVSDYWMENFAKPVNVNEVFTPEYAKDVTQKLVEMMKPAKV